MSQRKIFVCMRNGVTEMRLESYLARADVKQKLVACSSELGPSRRSVSERLLEKRFGD